MNLPNPLVLPKKQYDDLVALTAWYEQIPNIDNLYFGDYFFENLENYRYDCLFEHLELLESQYIGCIIFNKDDLYPLKIAVVDEDQDHAETIIDVRPDQ